VFVDLAKIRKKAKAAAAQAPTESEAAQEPGEPKPAEPTAAKGEPLLIQPATSAAPPTPDPLPQEDSRAAENALEDAPEASSSRLEKLLIFRLAGRRYAIPISDVSQIIDARQATPIPHAPKYVRGIFSLRGRIVLVLDGVARLGLPAGNAAEEGAKVVVLDLGEELFGLYAHGIEQVVEVDLNALEAPPESFLPQEQEFVEGVFHHRDRTVALLNLPLFLALDSSRRET
jgi:purine-binding chemotaxis protein CheW